MIISHRHKFIYFKSCKTAGTSIEVFLSAYCGDNDVITRIEEETADWHIARHYNGFRNHDTVERVRNLIKEKTFDEYYKFTSIRNPLDKMLSLFYFWKMNKNIFACGDDFNKFIIKYDFMHTKHVFHEPYYKINGQIVVDDYIRYESLEADLCQICNVLGIDYDGKYLLHYKKSKREDIEITEAAKDKIRDKFKQELIDLNYEI